MAGKDKYRSRFRLVKFPPLPFATCLGNKRWPVALRPRSVYLIIITRYMPAFVSLSTTKACYPVCGISWQTAENSERLNKFYRTYKYPWLLGPVLISQRIYQSFLIYSEYSRDIFPIESVNCIYFAAIILLVAIY